MFSIFETQTTGKRKSVYKNLWRKIQTEHSLQPNEINGLNNFSLTGESISTCLKYWISNSPKNKTNNNENKDVNNIEIPWTIEYEMNK